MTSRIPFPPPPPTVSPPHRPVPSRSSSVTVVARSMGMSRDAPEHLNDGIHDEASVVSDASNDNDTTDPHSTLVALVQQQGHGQQQQQELSQEYHGQAMTYLLNYETMVRQQEAEDMAVLAHIRPCVTRLMELVPPTKGPNDNRPFLVQEISLAELKQALVHLDQRKNDAIATQPETDFFTTDRQFMMVVRLLSSVPSSHHDVRLTWAEFIQCYKTCIAGMVTLQHLPVSCDTSLSRTRARNRTIQMLQLFTGVQPNARDVTSSERAMSGSTTSLGAMNKTDKERLYSSLTDMLPRGNKSIYKSTAKEIVPEISPSLWMSRTLAYLVAVALILCAAPYLYNVPSASRGYDSHQSNVSIRHTLARPMSRKKAPLAAFLNTQSVSPVRSVDSHVKPDTVYVLPPGPSHVSARAHVTLQGQPCNSFCRPLLGIWATFM